MKRYKKDLKSLNCLKIKVENSKNKFSLNIENCCTCRNSNIAGGNGIMLTNTKLHHHLHTCCGSTQQQPKTPQKPPPPPTPHLSKLSRSISEHCVKNTFKYPTATASNNTSTNTKSRTDGNSSNTNADTVFSKQNSLFKSYDLPATRHHHYDYEITTTTSKSKPNASRPNKKETITSKYNFLERINPIPMREENFSRRFPSKLPDTRLSLDKLYSQESTTNTTTTTSSTSNSTDTHNNSSNTRPRPPAPSPYQVKTDRRFYTLRASNGPHLLKEPVKSQRMRQPSPHPTKQQPNYNDSDSYLDSIRHMSTNELNNYIEKLITQFRIKSRLSTTKPKLSKPTMTATGQMPRYSSMEPLESSRLNASNKNLYRDDLFVVSEMSLKNSNASEDTYIKNLLKEEEDDDEEEENDDYDDQPDSRSIGDLKLEEESDESNDLINYTHSYELEELSSQNTSFNQEESSQSAQK